MFHNKKMVHHNCGIYLSPLLINSRINGKQFFNIPHRKATTKIHYSLDGLKFLSSSLDATIKEWSTLSGQCLQTLYGHRGAVNFAVYSPSQKFIISASSDKTTKLWSAASGECLLDIETKGSEILCALYSPDAKKNFLGSKDTTIHVWCTETKKELSVFKGHFDSVTFLAMSPDRSKFLSVSNNIVKEWTFEVKNYFRYRLTVKSKYGQSGREIVC